MPNNAFADDKEKLALPVTGECYCKAEACTQRNVMPQAMLFS